jgi:hypothetical protein
MRSLIVLFLGVVSLASIAEADDNCSEKLLSPNITVHVSDQRSQSFVFDTMCKLDYDAFNKQWGASASGYYFGIGGSGAYNENTYKQAQHDLCTSNQRSNADSALAYDSSEIIPQEARDSYVQCMQRRTLSCIAEPHDNNVIIKIFWNPATSGQNYIHSVNVTNGSRPIPLPDLPVNSSLPRQNSAVIINNYKRGEELVFYLTVYQQDINNQFVGSDCSVYIPKPVAWISYRGTAKTVYGNQADPPVATPTVPTGYRFVNAGPGLLRIYPNGARCTIPLPAKKAVTVKINQGPMNLRAEPNNSTAQVFYERVDAGDQTVDDKCPNGFIYEEP